MVLITPRLQRHVQHSGMGDSAVAPWRCTPIDGRAARALGRLQGPAVHIVAACTYTQVAMDDETAGADAGAAAAIANALVTAGHAMGGPVAIQVALYLATVVLANIVSNNAAAALMYPIAVTIAEGEGLDKPRTAFLLMLAASASFAVPFAYQTNLMVYGAGGYTFRDFLRFGGPLQVRQPHQPPPPPLLDLLEFTRSLRW